MRSLVGRDGNHFTKPIVRPRESKAPERSVVMRFGKSWPGVPTRESTRKMRVPLQTSLP
jgi:hypothetical protein